MNGPPSDSLIMQVLSEFGYTGSEEEVVSELRALLGPPRLKPQAAHISDALQRPRPTSSP